MLGKKDIEELATSAVKCYFNLSNSVSPRISENDKTPDWDGVLSLYKGVKDERKNYVGDLKIQIKGREVTEFKEKETYPVETVFLRNSLNEGFVFFVVEVKTDGTNKIFYKMMAPIEIRGELELISKKEKKSKRQNQRNIQLEPLNKDSALVEILLHNFYVDCVKQKSFASSKELKIENLKNISNYQWGFRFQGKKGSIIRFFFDGFKSFVYIKTAEGTEIPLGNAPLTIKIPELVIEKKEPVIIGEEIVCKNYILSNTKDTTSFELTSLLVLRANHNSSSNRQICSLEILADSTMTQIKAYSIFIKIVKYGGIKFGDVKIDINVDEKSKLVSELSERLSELQMHQEVLDVLHVKSDIDYHVFTEKDNFSLKQLYNAFVKHMPIGLNNPQPIFKLDIANISVLLACESDKNGKYLLYDPFEYPFSIEVHNIESPFQVPLYSFFKKEGYVLFDNITFDGMLEAYEKFALLDTRIYNQATLDLLQMLKAVDELKSSGKIDKSEYILNSAYSLAKWILETDNDQSLKNLHQLNLLQIIKRQRYFTKEERGNLLYISQDNSNIIKAAAHLLLDNKELFQYYFQQMKEEEKQQFVDFPIYVFAN